MSSTEAKPLPNRSIAYLVRELASAQKSAHGGSLYLVKVNRPAGRLFAAISYKLGLTPNVVTIIGGLLTYLACILIPLASSSVMAVVLIVVALLVGYALDSADGQLARLRGGGTLAGEFLDRCFDTGKYVLIHSAFVVSFVLNGELNGVWIAIVGVMYLFADAVLPFAATIRVEMLKRVPGFASAAKASSGFSWPKGVLYLLNEYGVLCIVVVLLPFGLPALLAYSAMALVAFLLSLGFVVKWSREFSALG